MKANSTFDLEISTLSDFQVRKTITNLICLCLSNMSTILKQLLICLTVQESKENDLTWLTCKNKEKLMQKLKNRTYLHWDGCHKNDSIQGIDHPHEFLQDLTVVC